MISADRFFSRRACIFGMASAINENPDDGWFPTLVGQGKAASLGPASKSAAFLCLGFV